MSRSSSKYYCDYCDCYLVSQSIAVRKQHNNGAKHKANVKAYYLQFLQANTQKTIDQTVRARPMQPRALQRQSRFGAAAVRPRARAHAESTAIRAAAHHVAFCTVTDCELRGHAEIRHDSGHAAGYGRYATGHGWHAAGDGRPDGHARDAAGASAVLDSGCRATREAFDLTRRAVFADGRHAAYGRNDAPWDDGDAPGAPQQQQQQTRCP